MNSTKRIAMMALMLNAGIAGMYAQQFSVKMFFSGAGGASAIDLKQPNTNNVEENVAGRGTLGSFTFRNVSAETAFPQQSSTCSGPNLIAFSRVAGAGIFRFQDVSLLNVTVTQGDDCIDLAQLMAHCTLTLQITGGTGRFKNASGVLTYAETTRPVLADASNNPVFFNETGEITGEIAGLSAWEDSEGERR